jgi:hypothetical protein
MRLVLLGLALAPASAAIFQFDDARPALSVGGQPVQWHSGTASQWVLSSLLVRLHPRGLLFRPPEWHPRDLAALGWHAEPCAPCALGLCQTATSVMFPTDQPPVISQDGGDTCGSTATRRVITNASRYDASACDVLDAATDFVYSGNAIRSARTELPAWIYWTVCVLVVYLVRCLSKFILASLERRQAAQPPGPQRQPPDPLLCLCACAACVALILSQGDACFVTEEDLLFHWFTVFYICAYGALFLGARGARLIHRVAARDPPFYNLLAGVLQLVATRLYVGAETPYNPPLVFVVAVRALMKSRRSVDLLRGTTLALDGVMLGLMCVLGFSPDPRYLLAIFGGAGAWVDFLV